MSLTHRFKHIHGSYEVNRVVKQDDEISPQAQSTESGERPQETHSPPGNEECGTHKEYSAILPTDCSAYSMTFKFPKGLKRKYLTSHSRNKDAFFIHFLAQLGSSKHQDVSKLSVIRFKLLSDQETGLCDQGVREEYDEILLQAQNAGNDERCQETQLSPGNEECDTHKEPFAIPPSECLDSSLPLSVEFTNQKYYKEMYMGSKKMKKVGRSDANPQNEKTRKNEKESDPPTAKVEKVLKEKTRKNEKESDPPTAKVEKVLKRKILIDKESDHPPAKVDKVLKIISLNPAIQITELSDLASTVGNSPIEEGATGSDNGRSDNSTQTEKEYQTIKPYPVGTQSNLEPQKIMGVALGPDLRSYLVECKNTGKWFLVPTEEFNCKWPHLVHKYLAENPDILQKKH